MLKKIVDTVSINEELVYSKDGHSLVVFNPRNDKEVWFTLSGNNYDLEQLKEYFAEDIKKHDYL